MSDSKKINPLRSPKNIVLLLLAIAFISGIFYLLNLRANILYTDGGGSKKDIYEKTTTDSGEEKTTKLQYPANANLPNFVIRQQYDVPKELNAGYDSAEFLSFRVVSDGKISMMKIKDPKTNLDMGTVTRLEVHLDDSQGYMKNNASFNISLKTTLPDGSGTEISPPLIKFALQDNALLDQEAKTELGNRYDQGEITEAELDNLFKKDSVWIIEPYLLSNYINSSIEGSTDPYTQLLDSYYSGDDSKFMDAVLKKDTSLLKQPVMIWNLYTPQ